MSLTASPSLILPIAEVFAEALGLNETELAQVQDSVRHCGNQFEMLALQRTFVTNAMPQGIGFHYEKGKLFTLVTPEFPDEGAELKRRLVAELEQAVGPERAETLMRQAEQMFETDFLSFGKYQRWVAASPNENGGVTLGKSSFTEGQSIGGSVTQLPFEKLPDALKPLLAPHLKK